MTTWGDPLALWGDPGVAWDARPDTPVPDHTATPSPRDLADLLLGPHRALRRAVIHAPGDPLHGTEVPITGGRLTLTYDEAVRCAGSLTVAPTPLWADIDDGGPLDPRTGREVVISTGVVDDTGTEHWWQVGVLRARQPALHTSADDIGLTVEAWDRSGVVQHASIDRAWTIESSTGILAGIRDALAYVAPWLPVDLPLDQDEDAGSDITLVEKPGDDLWVACRDLARSLGRLLHVDATGTVVAPLVTLPQAAEPIEVPLTAWEASVDYDAVVHAVAAQWVEPRPDDAPQEWVADAGTVIATDPAAEHLPVGVPKVVRPYSGDSSVLTGPSHARAAATVQLADSIDRAVSGSCVAVPHPDVMPGAVIVGPDEHRYRITRVELDLAGGPVGVALGNRARGLTSRLSELFSARTPTERDEVVTSLAPLTSRPITDPDGTPRLVEPTDATRGVVVGDPIRVRSDGAGRRVAVALLVPKPLASKYSGERVGTVGGRPLDVGGNADLRVRTRVGNTTNPYTSFSGGDVTIDVPAPPPPPNLSNYTQKQDIWRLNGYGWSPTLPGAPASWDSSWGTAIINALVSLRNTINNTRQVYWYRD